MFSVVFRSSLVDRSIKLNSNPGLLAPNQATVTDMIAFDVKGEFFRNSKRASDVERCTVLGQITNRAVDRAAAELD